MRPLITVLLMALGALALPALAAEGTPPQLAAEAAGYAPADSCAGCHTAEARAWQDSDHAWAMREATPDTVLGDFNEVTFKDGEVQARFFRHGNRFLATLAGPEESPREVEIRYTFGVRPLQQYLVAMPGGRLQALTIAWDTRPAREGGQRWFSLYPGEAFAPDDPLHWTGRYQNWNAMCADCHSTNLEKHYDADSDSFATTWHEQTVGCQSCHGPSQPHVAWAVQWSSAHVNGDAVTEMSAAEMGLPVDLSAMDGPELVEQCARCHSRRQMLGVGHQPGTPLLDVALPSLLSEGLYHADGQIQGEVYVYGSFAQSRMYAAGVGCSDCHDPHTSQVKIEGNGLCVQCHNPAPPERFPGLRAGHYDSAAHHHHPEGTVGAQCVSCHMPATTYMQVDPRRDHAFQIPRPDLAKATGSPNACTGCHQGRSPGQAARTLSEWFDSLEPPAASPHYGKIFRAARRGKPDVLEELVTLAGDGQQPAIVRATAVDELAAYGAPALPTLEAALADDSALVRASAAPIFAQAPVGPRVQRLLPLLEDPRRAVRDEALKALAGVPPSALPAAHREAFRRDMADYAQRLRDNADLPGNRLNLAVFLARDGRIDEAMAHYRQALAMDPYFAPARVNLVTLASTRGESDTAERVLREGLALDAMPAADRGHLAYLLALLLIEEGKPRDGLRWLETAADLRPDDARVRYNQGLLLLRLNRRDEARVALEAGLERRPEDPDLLYALVYLHATANELPQAREYLGRLREVRPNDQRLARLAHQLGSGP